MAYLRLVLLLLLFLLLLPLLRLLFLLLQGQALLEKEADGAASRGTEAGM